MLLLHQPAHILYHDNRVIHHDADRKDQPEQRRHIDAVTDPQHDGERSDKRNGNGNRRNQRGTPVLKKKKCNEHHQQNRLEKRIFHLVNRCGDKFGRIILDAVFQVFREKIVLQAVQTFVDLPGNFQSVCLIQLINCKHGGGFAVQR